MFVSKRDCSGNDLGEVRGRDSVGSEVLEVFWAAAMRETSNMQEGWAED